MLYSNKYFFDQYHQYYHSQYQSGYHSVRILDTTRSRTQGLSRIPQSISLSIRIQLSLYSQVSVLRNKIQLNLIPNLYLSFKKVIQDASCLLTKQQLLSHRNQSRVLFQLTFILNYMIEVNIITSFTSLFTIVNRLIVIQVLRSYLQAHLDFQTMYNVIYLGVFSYKNIGFAPVFITY